MKVALDSNVLLHAEGVDDRRRALAARELVNRLPAESTVIAIQALGECYNVLVRKAGYTREHARDAIRRWRARFMLADTTDAVMEEAIALATQLPMSVWDAVQLAAAAQAGCDCFLSEDLQDGFRWRGLTVVNPFAPARRAWIEARLKDV